jgi:hypothetical protein
MATSDKALMGGRVIPVSNAIQQRYGRCAAMLLQQVHFWCAARRNVVDGEAWASVITLKPATCGHFKTGHFGWSET